MNHSFISTGARAMQITVNIDETVIINATRKAFAEAFRSPEYRGERGAGGYETVRAQVNEYVRTLDLREYIQGAARAALNAVVRDVLEAELRAHVKKTVREMKQEGELFEEQKK